MRAGYGPPPGGGGGGGPETDPVASAALDAHLADSSDAHDASAISFAPTGSLAATDVQAAVAEAASEAASGIAAKQDADGDLTAIAGLSPSNDDVIQRKSGAWTNRTPAQVKTDLALTKSDVGLGNVDNTSDANKPVSTAQQTALDLKQNAATAATDAELASEAATRAAADTALDGRVDDLEQTTAQDATFFDQGAADRDVSVARSRVTYEDAPERVYEDVSEFTQGAAGAIKAAAGVIRNDEGVAGTPHTAVVLLPGGTLGATERLRVVCKLNVVALGGTGITSIGLGDETTPNPAADTDSDHLATFGIDNSDNTAFRLGGAAGESDAQVGTTVFAAGAHQLVVEVDEHVISFSLMNAAGTKWEGHRLARDAATASALGISEFTGDITSIAIHMTDSRGASGCTFGPIGVKRGSATLKARVGPAFGVAIEGNAPEVFWGGLAAADDDPFTYVSPPGWDGRRPVPTVLWLHGSSRDEKNFAVQHSVNATHAQFAADLLAAGWGLLLPDGNGNNWGNQFALDSAEAAYDWATRHRAIGPIVALGLSMGALTAANLISRRTVPGIHAFVGIYPALSLADMYADATFTSAINTAYNIPGGGTYAAQTAGFDPLLQDPAVFRGIPMRFYASPSDTATVKTENADPFAALVDDHVPEVTVVAATGAHGDASHYDSTDVLEFLERVFPSGVEQTTPTPEVLLAPARTYSIRGATTGSWQNMPAAATQFFEATVSGGSRFLAYLVGARLARFSSYLGTLGVSTAKLWIEFSTDNGSTWDELATTVASGELAIGTGVATANAVNATGWFPIAALAKGDVMLRVMGSGGDGAVDPTFGITQLEIR